MNNENFKNEIEERWKNRGARRGKGRVWTGLFLLIIGGFLLLKTAQIIIFPGWFFTWPMLLIAIGLFSAIRHGFDRGFWIILVLVGSIFLAGKIDPAMHLERYMWPVILMAIGLVFILKPKRKSWDRCHYGPYDSWNKRTENTEEKISSSESTATAETIDRSDFLDVTSVFGGVKKNVLSKNFKGGDIVSFMGGSEIDLTQADFNGRITIDATNIFGGTKLIVPASWDVQSDITAIFGGVDDKRQIHGVTMDPNKILILDGSCVFGGIEIRSY